jgi:hydroxymethylbilane synthase
LRLVLATRKSQLALAQARAWVRTLCLAHPALAIDELHVVTTGDRITDRPLQAIGGKGLFLKEIEEALIVRRADLAVHSVKDVPAELAPGLVLAAIPPREDPRDVLVSRSGGPLASLSPGARVGTSSLRRSVMLRRLRPDLRYEPVRGNVDTRLRKVGEGEFDAIVLAYAGLRRLGLGERASEIFDAASCIPAAGQGALGIECRADDDATAALLRATHDPETAIAVACERGALTAVEGSCQVPVAAHASRGPGGALLVRAMLAREDGSDARFLEETFAWPATEAAARALGEELGGRLRHPGSAG